VSLLGVHNWFFGHQFVPMTQAAFIPENLTAPPRVYRAGLLDRAARTQAFEHLWSGLTGPSGVLPEWLIPRLRLDRPGTASLRVLGVLGIKLLALILLVRALLSLHRADWPLSVLLIASTGLVVPLLFYQNVGRFGLLPWAFVELAAVVAGSRGGWPWSRRC
jgi:hypothetical protein